MATSEAWLVGGVRSPFGRFCGGLSGVPLVNLAGTAVRGALDNASWSVDEISEMIAGIAMIEGGMLVPARLIAFESGLPEVLPTLTIDRGCCSGMTVVGLAMRSLAAGAHSVMCVGMESMSRTPRLLHDTRTDSRRGDLIVEDPLLLRSPITGTAIATYAGHEALARGVDREQQDAWAMQSHARFFEALKRGFFKDEIVPVETSTGFVQADEQPRAGVNLEALAKLPTVYDSPTVTAGNAPGLNDGACALIVAGRSAVKKSGVEPLAQLVDYLQIAGPPTSAVFLPGTAIRRILDTHGLSADDVDVIEINEAFAATAVVSIKELAGNDRKLEARLVERTNVNGGAVAIGHPTGASGARILLTAARQLAEKGGAWGVAAICGGFGQTDVVLLRRP
jgi:acetyl-CoA C-acetyltransferase